MAGGTCQNLYYYFEGPYDVDVSYCIIVIGIKASQCFQIGCYMFFETCFLLFLPYQVLESSQVEPFGVF